MSLEGRIAIVTGGSRGIGRATVMSLARAGADIAFCYLSNEEAAKSTTDSVEAMGCKCIAFRVDVTDYETVKEMVNKTVVTFGGIDILVNNAGIVMGRNYLADEDIESMHQVINTHVFGAAHLVKADNHHIKFY